MNNPNLTEEYIKLELASNLSSNYEIINDVNNILWDCPIIQNLEKNKGKQRFKL
jgi:hypothetical protein